MSRIFLLVVLFGVARGCNKATQGPTFNFNLVEYPLYCGNSVKEFLSICKDVEWPKPDKGQDWDKWRELNRKKNSKCKEPIKPCSDDTSSVGPEPVVRIRTEVELWFLKDAQKKIKDQQDYLHSPWRGIVAWILFLIPLSLAIYLMMAGHFDYRTLPFFGNQFQSDSTDGLKYQQYEWMGYRVLPGNHAVFKGVDPDEKDESWLQYTRQDDTFEPKSVTSFSRFKFLERTDITQVMADEEYAKKIHVLKHGWDLDPTLDKKPHHQHAHHRNPKDEEDEELASIKNSKTETTAQNEVKE